MMNNIYRVFVSGSMDYNRYMLGDIVDHKNDFDIKNVDYTVQRIPFNKKTKEYKSDNSVMRIDEIQPSSTSHSPFIQTSATTSHMSS